MKHSIYRLIKQASDTELNPIIQEFAKANDLVIGDGDNEVSKEDVLEQMHYAEEALFSQFTGKNLKDEAYRAPHISLSEALSSADSSILFKRVISEVMVEPNEPALFLQNTLAEHMVLDAKNPLYIEFPVLGAIQAFDMAEGQEYHRQTLSVQQHITSIRLEKIGAATSVPQEVIDQSIYPIIAIYLRQLAAAVNRRVESKLMAAMKGRARVVFDNENSDTTYQTTGRNAAQSWNATFTYNDLVKMAGVIIGSNYTPTHVLAHPLAWPIFATDPIIRAQFYNGGQMGSQIWNSVPQFDQTPNFPWGISYVPYYGVDYHENHTLTGAGSGLAAELVSDMYMVDKNNSLLLATRGETEMDRMDDWFKDATSLKARKYAGVAIKDTGKGMTRASAIRVTQNESPIFTIRTTSS